MPNPVARKDDSPGRHPCERGKVEVKDGPTGLLIIDTLQVLYHRALVRTDDQTRRGSSHPGRADEAAGLVIRRTKIHGRPGRAIPPTPVRPTCEKPGYAGLK